MTYCTQQNLIDRFGSEELLQLTERDNEGEINATVVAQAIADATAEINGYVEGAGYSVPMSPVPPILVSYACDMARYRLYDDHATEQVTKRYNDALKFLTLVAQGTVKLGASETPAAIGEAHMTTGRPDVFHGGGF